MAASTALAPLADAQLSERQRQQGLIAIGITTFCSWGGYFLVVPLVAVHYVDQLGWAAATIGLLLAIRQFTQQSVGIVFGVLCDRIGPKPLILAGMILRGLGFATMAYASTFWLMLGSLLLAALGGAMFDSPKSAATAYLALPEQRQRVYSILGVIGGIGVTVGTQIGAFLIGFDFKLVCFASSVVYLAVFFAVIVLLPPIKVSSGTSSAPMTGIGRALKDRTFMIFLILMSGYWFAWTQFSLTITLAATDIAGTVSAVSWIYLVNTGITVGIGYFLPTWLGKWLKPIDLVVWGMVIISIGLAIVGFATGTPSILFAAGVFSVGVVISRPGQETVTANLADPAARGTYFGVAYLSMAIGGGLGNLIGGIAYDYGKNNDLQMETWMGFAAIGAVSALGLWLYRSSLGIVREEDAAGNAPVIHEAPSPTHPAPITAGQ
jgi:DHA1 family multidrug resistance protein-like MFS transporter